MLFMRCLKFHAAPPGYPPLSRRRPQPTSKTAQHIMVCAQLTICTGRRCWRNGAGLLLAAAQLGAPPELTVVKTACCGFCPPGEVLACEGPNCPGPTMLLTAADAEQAKTSAAEAIAAVVARGRTTPPQMLTGAPDGGSPPASAFEGAGEPRPSLPPEEVIPLLMRALQLNSFPEIDSGLHSMWSFAGDCVARVRCPLLSHRPRPICAGDTTRFIFGNNRTEFVESAHETADSLPTSFYGVALHGQSWELEGKLNRVGGEDGWIATQIMRTVSSDGRVRRWQWELRKHRRPPNQGAWFVESIGSSDRLGNFDLEG